MMKYIYGAIALIVLAGGIYINNLLEDSSELDRVKHTKKENRQFHDSEANSSTRVIEVYRQQGQVDNKVNKEIEDAKQASNDDDSYTILASDTNGVRTEADSNKTNAVQGVREVPSTPQGQYQGAQVVFYIINGQPPRTMRDTGRHEEASETNGSYESNYKRIREQYR